MSSWSKLVLSQGSGIETTLTGEDILDGLYLAVMEVRKEEPDGCRVEDMSVAANFMAKAAENLWDARNALRRGKGLSPITLEDRERGD